MRLIDIEPFETEKGAESCRITRWFVGDGYSTQVVTHTRDIPTIDPASLRPKGEWISAEERLPQVCGVYICCVKTKGGTTFTKTAEFVPEMKMWFGKFGEIKNIVTHWMPLPEPPNTEVAP